jgi:hypothetical protein
MTEEDEEFNRIEREAAMRRAAVSATVAKKPWRSLSDAQYQHILKQTEGCGHLAFYNLIEKTLRGLNT